MKTLSQTLLLLLLACLSKLAHLDSLQESDHIFVNKKLNQTEAEKYCQDYHISLSSIQTDAENQKIQRLSSSLAWIGLVRGPQNWTWSTGSKPVYYNWNHNGDCVAVTTDRLWVVLPCQTEQPFICQTKDGKYNSISNKKMTWPMAKAHCESLGQKLATFKNVHAKLDTWPLSPHWIGLHKQSGSWTWVDSVEGQDSWEIWRFCALMVSDGRWRDDLCDNKHPFVCMHEQELELTRDRRTWHEAEKECRKKGMHLVTIPNASENTRVWKTFADPPRQFWIGLSNNPWQWLDGSNATYQKWGKGEPNNYQYLNEQCVITEEGLWYDVSCSLSYPFFCLKKKLTIETLAPSSWENALLHCRGQGEDLASIKNLENQELTHQAVRNAKTQYVWVGLHFLVGEWLWVSGGGLEFHNWAKGEGQMCPLHHCGAVDRTTGKWVSMSCREKLDFVCQMD